MSDPTTSEIPPVEPSALGMSNRQAWSAFLGHIARDLGIDPAGVPAEKWDEVAGRLEASFAQLLSVQQSTMLGSGALYPHEVEALKANELDPDAYMGFDMQAAGMQITNPQGAPAPLLDARVILAPNVARLPMSRLVLAGGGPTLPKHFIAPVPVLVRVVMMRSARPEPAA